MIALHTVRSATINFHLTVIELTVETARWNLIFLAGFTFHKEENSADGQQKEKEFGCLHNCRMASKLQLSRHITKQDSCTRMICLDIPKQIIVFISFVKNKL